MFKKLKASHVLMETSISRPDNPNVRLGELTDAINRLDGRSGHRPRLRWLFLQPYEMSDIRAVMSKVVEAGTVTQVGDDMYRVPWLPEQPDTLDETAAFEAESETEVA